MSIEHAHLLEQINRVAEFVYNECSQDIVEGELAVDTLIRIVREYHALQTAMAKQPPAHTEARRAWRTYAAAALVAQASDSIESLTRKMMALEADEFGEFP